MQENMKIRLWVKTEPFINGTWPATENRTTFNKERLLDLVNCKCVTSKCKKVGVFELGYSDWKVCLQRYITKQPCIVKILLDNFRLVSSKTRDERVRRDELLASSANGNVLADKSYEDEVFSVPEFVVLLYLQNVHSVEQCSSTYLEEEWSTLRSLGHNSKVFDEIKYFKFVKNNLEELVELVEEEALLTSGRLSLKSVDALGLIIEGFQDNSSVSSLMTLVMADKEKMDYMSWMGIETVSAEAFVVWIKNHLEVNPFGLAQCYKTGRKLPWIIKAYKKKWSSRNACIITNAHAVPAKKKIISFNGISNQTLARTSRILHGATVHIQQCNKSFIYLLSPMRSMWIENCHNCTLVLGPVATTCEVLSCTNLRLISVTRRIQIRKCTKCTLYLLTPSEPLLLENQNSEITFAPYNTFYAKLEEHMTAAGISKSLNKWDKPLALEMNQQTEQKIYTIMLSEEFSLFTIPFHMEGATKDVPIILPVEYRKQLNKANVKYQKWVDEVGKARLKPDESEHLNSQLRRMFWEWCIDSGHNSELLNLEAYTKHCQQTRTTE